MVNKSFIKHQLQMMTLEMMTAINAAVIAGASIMQIYGQSALNITLKEDNSPVTKADLESHRIINEKLSSTGIPILSEEGNPTVWEIIRKQDKYWLIDPLDGTKEFIKHSDEFTVNIALVEYGKPVLGVIYIPAQKLLFAGGAGVGAYKWTGIDNKNPISLSSLEKTKKQLPTRQKNSSFNVVGSQSHLTEATENFIARLSQSVKPIKFIQAGSSIKFCLIATGEADIYPRMDSIMEWDTAAGQAIVEGAGGSVLSWPDGNPILCNNPDFRNPNFIALAPGRSPDVFFV